MAGSVLAAQLYTVRDFCRTAKDFAASMKKVRAAGYEAVQLSGHGEDITAKELKTILDGEGLKCCATHVSYEGMRDELDRTVEHHQTLDCQLAGIGGLPGEYHGSAEGFARFAKEASGVGQKLAEHGLTFIYHNHSFELEKFGDRTGLQILYEDSDPKYFQAELDTYWVQHGGGDSTAWIRKVSGRLPALHLKDMTMQGHEQIMAEIGEGNLDWPAILEAAKKAGVEWYIVEQDTCQRDPFESLAISFRNLQAMGLK